MLKKLISVFVVLLLSVGQNINCYALDGGDLSASCAVLYYPAQNKVLLGKNEHQKRSMASTTKIMTSLLALEEGTRDRQVTITWEMVSVEGTSSGLRTGDIISLNDLVYCMMLESGNDAATAVALELCGTLECFAAKMNAKASQIGMKNTNFVTPSGLDDENHYSTAYDMALLASSAMQNKEFAYISGLRSYTVNFADSTKTVNLYNHNKLLKKYSSSVGIKTGFTKKSGRCLVSAAVQNGVMLIAVTLNAGDDWNDHIKMYDFGFSLFTQKQTESEFGSYAVPVTGGEKEFVSVDAQNEVFGVPCDEKVTRKIYLQKFLYAPVNKGDIIGYAEYSVGGYVIRSIPLTAENRVNMKKKQ